MSRLLRCENEFRLCLQEVTYDSYFDQARAQWHSYCDVRLPSVTTPPLASITTTWNPNDCAKYEKVCESAVYETNKCTTSVTAAVEFVSCVCRPKITSLYSSCWYDGGRKCAMENVQIEDIPGYSVCPGFQSGMVGAPVDMPAQLGKSGFIPLLTSSTSRPRMPLRIFPRL